MPGMKLDDKKHIKGMSLIEVIISSCLLLLITVMIAQCLITGMKTYNRNTKGTNNFRSATLGLDVIETELRQCQEIYFPADQTVLKKSGLRGTGYMPGKNGTPPFIFKRFIQKTNTLEVIAYTINYNNNKLIRMIYNNDFDKTNSATWNTFNSYSQDEKNKRTKILSTNVQDLEFQFGTTGKYYTKLLLIYFTSFPDKTYLPLQTKVNLR